MQYFSLDATMMPFRKTFESDKQQLQKLNGRLVQYLSRTKQLEQENASLITEINKLRQAKTAERDPGYKAEMRNLRRMVDQMSFEKSQTEMEKERLWRELQMVQSACGQHSEVFRDISGELKGCEKELHFAHKTNSGLQQRLFQLQNEYKSLEDAHRQEMEHLRRHAESRVVPIITQTYCGPPAATMEELQEYALGLSDGWIGTFEMYQLKVEEMELSIKADHAMLSDLQREKLLYASELDKLRTDAEKQGQMQLRLEEQLMHMQEKFSVDLDQYQMVIEQLEHERNTMADVVAEKMQEHQQLLQVKMDLGIEVAAYRALLEGERVGLQGAQRRGNQHPRERIIGIKMPPQPYTQRTSTSTRQHMDIRFTQPASNLRRSAVPPTGSRSPSRVIPISVTSRAQQQSPASRRDMISFTKARAPAASAPVPTTTKDKQPLQREDVRKKTTEEKIVKFKQVSQVEDQSSPVKSVIAETKSVRVVSAPKMGSSKEAETERIVKVTDEGEKGNASDSEFKDKGKTTIEKKVLDSVSVEDIIERVIKPAGLEARVCSSGESKIVYHMEETEQEDGTTKTQIVLESKVEEELDVSEDSALDELLCQGVKKVSLEDIKDTPTGSMIKNLLSGLQGDGYMQNKSVNVEIIEEPVESHSDEEYKVEQTSRSSFYEPSSAYFQVEELETVPHDVQVQRTEEDIMKTSMTDTVHPKSASVRVQEVVEESASSYISHEEEPHEYFVSTPDDNLSESEQGGGITSYGHYGIVDDLSDERYYQDESLLPSRVSVEESDEYKFTSGDRCFVKESFPECIIEEEIRVSPVVQESVLEFLREDSLEPKEQLRGALEKLQGSVSGPLREELAFLTKVSGESPQNVAVDFKKVQQSTDNGTMTIVAELNVSQTLEDSGLLEGEDFSEEKIMAALKSSNLEKAFQGGAGGAYSFRFSKEEDVVLGEEFEGFTDGGKSASDVTEPFIFQVEGHNSQTGATSDQEPQSDILETPMKISHEKRGARIYLESPTDD